MMRKPPTLTHWGLGLLWCLSASINSVHAENLNLPETVNLQQLVQILKEKSPRFAAERSRVDIAQADRVAAEALPNPRVTYGRYDHVSGKNTFFEGNQQQQTQVDIPVLIAGQRPVRREAAERSVTAAEAQVENAYAELLKNSWHSFVKLLSAQQKLAALEHSETELDRLKKIVTGRAESGAASRYDVMRMTIESADLHARIEQVRADTIDIAGGIGTMLSLPGWKPKAEGLLQPLGVNVDLAALKTEAETVNPAINAARRQEDRATAIIEKTKRERWPTPVISFGNAWTNHPDGMVTFGQISVEIPLFDRGQGAIAKAEAEKRTTTYERQALSSAIQAELERAAALLVKNRENLGRFEEDVAGHLPELKQMAEDAYLFSKSNLLELLDATRAQNELAIRKLELTEAVVLAEIDTLAAAGLLDSDALAGISKQR
ncbi:MAG: hypothetical protein CTY16_19200 [Methylobacter sp.]|nr:MAG: hypothetical protein CTY16_19200 [Methylobacter sp.]